VNNGMPEQNKRISKKSTDIISRPNRSSNITSLTKDVPKDS